MILCTLEFHYERAWNGWKDTRELCGRENVEERQNSEPYINESVRPQHCSGEKLVCVNAAKVVK